MKRLLLIILPLLIACEEGTQSIEIGSDSETLRRDIDQLRQELKYRRAVDKEQSELISNLLLKQDECATRVWVEHQGYATQEMVDDNTLHIDLNTAQIAQLQTNQTDMDGEIKRFDTRLDELLDTTDQMTVDLQSLQDGVIREDTEWTIGHGPSADYPSLHAALDAARKHTIRSNATLKMRVSDGTYTLTSPLNLNHAQGQHIYITGNTKHPENVTLYYVGKEAAVEINTGHSMRMFRGFTIQGQKSGVGIRVHDHSYASFGDLVVTEFEDGIVYEGGSAGYLIAGTVRIENTTANGLFAIGNSHIMASEIEIDGAGGIGALAAIGSVLDIRRGLIEDSGRHGVVAKSGGYVNATLVESNANGAHGFHSFMGQMTANDSVASANNGSGYMADVGAIYAKHSQASYNKSHGYQVDRMAHINATATSGSTSNGSATYNVSEKTGINILRNIEQAP